MAEITAKRSGELVRGIFQILYSEPEGLQAKVVLERVEELVPPTPFEDAGYPKNLHIRRYPKMLRFNTIGPVKAGWLVKDRGQWTLTDEGRQAYDTFSDPEKFYRESRRLYKEWEKGQPPKEMDEADDDAGATTATLEEAEENAWEEITEHLEEMAPYDFQNLVAGLLRGMGRYVSWVAPPGPDRGIDILASADPLGVSGPQIKVQVKRRKDRIPVEEIRAFLAVLGDSDAGLYVATGGFTKDAVSEARHQEKRRLMLIDSKRLFDLWTEHYPQIPEEARRLLPIRPVHYLDLGYEPSS